MKIGNEHQARVWSSMDCAHLLFFHALTSPDISRSKFNSESYLKSSKSSNLPQLLWLMETPEKSVWLSGDFYLLCCSALFSLKLMCYSVLLSGDQQTLMHLPKRFPPIPCCASNTFPSARVEQCERTSSGTVTSGIYSVKA